MRRSVQGLILLGSHRLWNGCRKIARGKDFSDGSIYDFLVHPRIPDPSGHNVGSPRNECCGGKWCDKVVIRKPAIGSDMEMDTSQTTPQHGSGSSVHALLAGTDVIMIWTCCVKADSSEWRKLADQRRQNETELW